MNSRRRASFLLLAAALLPGCVSGPREYDYSVDIRNASDVPVRLELLRVDSRNVVKVRTDLAPGGAYVSSFTLYDSDYLEARLRPFDAPPDGALFVYELPKGGSRRDIISKDGRLVLTPRPAQPDRAD